MMLRRVGLGLLICAACILQYSAAQSQNNFWASWSDGQAELNGYTIERPRYGELRKGHAVLVYVTEPFSRSRLVKVDRYSAQNPDHFIALKLNRIERFQTGIYDYALMTSVFSDPSSGFQPVKSSFTAQEWCGHVYEEVRHLSGGTEVETRSYFEGETKTVRLDAALHSEDALFVTARGLMQGGPQAHKGGTVRMLAASSRRRLRHQPAVAFETTVTWSPLKTVTVPAGQYQVRSMSWKRQDGVQCVMDVAIRAPWSIVGWRCTDGEAAKLTGTTRGAYWNQVRSGDEALLKVLGLRAPARP